MDTNPGNPICLVLRRWVQEIFCVSRSHIASSPLPSEIGGLGELGDVAWPFLLCPIVYSFDIVIHLAPFGWFIDIIIRVPFSLVAAC